MSHQYPGQGGYPPPVQGGYPPPPQGYQQPPPQSYPQQPYGAPPPQPGYNSQQYQQYPPHPQQGAPPLPPHPTQQQYPQQYPPPGQPPHHGAPPPQPGYHQGYQAGYAPPPPGPPQGQQYGYQQPPPQSAYGQAPLGPPSPGYEQDPLQVRQAPMTSQAQGILKNLKKFNVDEKALIRDLAKLDPYQIASLNRDWNAIPARDRDHKSLSEMIEKAKGTSDFAKTCAAIARGPLDQDVYLLHKGTAGLGTKESLLDDVLMCRSNADIFAIRDRYKKTYGQDLEKNLADDLSGDTGSMFAIIVRGQRSEEMIPANAHEAEADAKAIHQSMSGMVAKYKLDMCSKIILKNNAQIAAIAYEFQKHYGKTLIKFIKDELFAKSHMENALVLFVERAMNLAQSDAAQLEQSMAGIGTNELLLLNRVVRAHWNPQHLHAVKQQYTTLKGKTLEKRIDGETGGDFGKLLIACVQ